MPSSIAKSIVFDTNLLLKGSWKEQDKKLIEEWIKEDGFEEKRAVASSLVSDMICVLLKEDCSEYGRVRSKRLGELLQHFEDLLATTKGGMAKKFYRDHLNHMLRVMLLASAFAKNIQSFSLSGEEAKLVILAGLVHDIAYPLSESCQILNQTIKAMKKCYGALAFPEFLICYDMKRVTKLLETLDLEHTPLSSFGTFLNEYNHGLLGAIEFVDYISQEKLEKYVSLLRAMVFHDPSLKIPECLRKDPILQALVLSDEIQDWGRPAALEKEPAIAEIDDFKIDSNAVRGNFKWREDVDVSPLRQIHAKASNFSRFAWPASLHVDLSFELPSYDQFELGSFHETVKNLIEYCQKERPDAVRSLNESWKDSKELFKSFYGNALPKSDDLPKYVIHHKILNEQQDLTYFANERKEILHTNQDMGRPDTIKLEINSGSIGLILRGEKRECKGNLYCQSQNIAKQLAEGFVARLIVFHGLASRIARKNAEGIVRRYPFPSHEHIEKAMQISGFKGKADPLVEELRGLRKCLVEGGFFSFQSEKKGPT